MGGNNINSKSLINIIYLIYLRDFLVLRALRAFVDFLVLRALRAFVDFLVLRALRAFVDFLVLRALWALRPLRVLRAPPLLGFLLLSCRLPLGCCSGCCSGCGSVIFSSSLTSPSSGDESESDIFPSEGDGDCPVLLRLRSGDLELSDLGLSTNGGGGGISSSGGGVPGGNGGSCCCDICPAGLFSGRALNIGLGISALLSRSSLISKGGGYGSVLADEIECSLPVLTNPVPAAVASALEPCP